MSPEVTIVVVPRERFSLTEKCLETIEARTPEAHHLIVIDGKSPGQVSRMLKAWEAAHENCRVLRTKRFLYPYEAKNIALEHLKTEWAVFVDSDVMVGPRWLTHLLEAAHAMGGNVVHPLYLVEQEGKLRIHMTDGKIHERESGGRTHVHPVMGHAFQHVGEARDLTRKESDFLEFHCFMIRRSLLERLGPFDPYTLAEDMHFSFRLRQLNEKIIFEPRSVITYVAGPPFAWDDLPYFRFRWDLERGRESVTHMRRLWSFTEAWCTSKLSWERYHHSRALPGFSIQRRVRHWTGRTSSEIVRQLRALFPILRKQEKAGKETA